MSTEKRGPFDYKDDPERPSPHLIIRNKEPFNAEPALPVLVRNYVTPINEFFKRNHGPIPNLGLSHTVDISAPALTDAPPRAFSVTELQTMPRLTITAAIQCAGNRRDGLNKLAPVRGVIWGPGTIGNAMWSGVPLRDVLLAAGIPDYTDPRVRDWHVSLEAVGECEEDVVYGSSIPLWLAMDPRREALLALEMNGRTLTRDHGYPVRLIVPGVIGARSVKWLKRIIIQPEESASFYQQRDYKILPPHVGKDELQEWWPRLAAIQELNVQCVICSPEDDQVAPNGLNLIRGYAISGGGRAIERVDVSLDGGKTWQLADLFHPNAQPDRHWGWTLWSLHVTRLPLDAEIVCRAWDVAGNTQPEYPVYNYRGVMNNAHHRISLRPPAKY